MHRHQSFPKEDISHCGSRSPKYIELNHFTLLFRRGRQRNVPRFKTHVHSYCSAHQIFCLVTLSSSSPSWFAKTPYAHCYATGYLQQNEQRSQSENGIREKALVDLYHMCLVYQERLTKKSKVIYFFFTFSHCF